jgi:4-amino-4-deoxy-L-arabinose transferase-like glycosyltransferase
VRARNPPLLTRRQIFIALAAGLVVRLFFIALVDYNYASGDAFEYDRLARNLAAHGTFSESATPPYEPSVQRAPGYPIVVATFYAIAGHHYAPIIALQVLLSLATCVLLALAAGRLSPRLALPVLWATALSPSDAVYTVALLSETLFTFLLAVAVAAPLLIKGRVRWLVCGLALGAGAITRDVFLLLTPLVALLVAIGIADQLVDGERRPRGERLGDAATVALAAIVCIAPWTIRNQSTTGRAVLISKGHLGENLWIASWEVDEHWFDNGPPKDAPPGSYSSLEEKAAIEKIWHTEQTPERDDAFRQMAINNIKRSPLRVLMHALKRFPRMWAGSRLAIFGFRPSLLARGKPAWLALKGGLTLLNTAVLLLGIAGMALVARARDRLLWFAVPIVYAAGIFFPLHNAEVRYSQPVYPLVILFACYTALRLVDWRSARRSLGQPRQAEPVEEHLGSPRRSELAQ